MVEFVLKLMNYSRDFRGNGRFHRREYPARHGEEYGVKSIRFSVKSIIYGLFWTDFHRIWYEFYLFWPVLD